MSIEVDNMGVIFSGLSIVAGTLLGSIFKEKVTFKNVAILGISIMIISLVGFMENIFGVEDIDLKSQDLLVVVFALIVGTIIGDMIHLDSMLSHISGFGNKGISEFLDTIIFFGVGGMQICGPIMLASVGDNSLLILKGMIDFPFALMFGMSYGKKVALSALPVLAGQLLVIILTVLSKSFLEPCIIKQVCAMGYIILFFSGFNIVCDKQHKINNVNMLIGILLILFYNAVRLLWR